NETSVTRTAIAIGESLIYQWSNDLGLNATANISSSGTYTVTVTESSVCSATATTSVTQNLALTASATNNGPYIIGQTIQLNGSSNGSGTTTYTWTGPAGFVSSSQNTTILNALSANSGTYTLTVISGICTSTATTNIIISGIDPCVQIVDYQYVKSGNPYQPLFSLKDGMVIQQIQEQVSIMAVPICPTIP
ncbi:immunoglobulin domain-containing protein, partial [Massilia pinisoli]|uniref:immunoglobulin domain-containing protein n=1 Tax=Massilia pinisoli TaxID=1772194 RepID=UPI0036448FAD